MPVATRVDIEVRRIHDRRTGVPDEMVTPLKPVGDTFRVEAHEDLALGFGP
jgi:hypothetical protein